MFDFLVEVESLERARSGAIWGNVWHEFSGQSFPHRRWNDMIIPYVVAFAHGVHSALNGKGSQVMFFDGPFSVQIVPDGPVVRLTPEGGPGLLGCEVEAGELSSKVVRVGNQLIEACGQRGWAGDDDVRQLESAVRNLVQLGG